MVAFENVKYESDTGDIHLMRLLPVRAAVAGTPPAAATTSSIKVKVSKTNGEYGIRPRGVTLSRVLGTAPDTFSKTSFLPVVTPADFATSTFQLGETVTIDSVVWTIISRKAEDY